MFQLEVLHVQYLIFMAAAGLLLLIGIVLGYLTIWRPRIEQEPVPADQPRHVSAKEWLGFIPWIIVGMIVFLFVWGITYVILAARHPPNI